MVNILSSILSVTFFGSIYLELFVVVILIALSAMYAAAEVAYFSLSAKQLHTFKELKGDKKKQILKHLENPKRLLAILLVSNNFVNVGIVIFTKFILDTVFPSKEESLIPFLIDIVGITFIILLFGEVMPKTYATKHAKKIVLFMLLPIKYAGLLFAPIIYLLMKSTRIIDRRLAKRTHSISMVELSHALDLTTDKTQLDEEKRMLKGIVEFGDIDVKEIMTARIDVVSVDVATSLSVLKKVIIESGYSRIPVYKDTFDHIEGILYIKDLLPYIKKTDDFAWQTLLRPAFFVPESKKINHLLKEFQNNKIHMAIVVDEYGGTSGIVTLEDIIEEIVGEINDEFDDEDLIYSKISDSEYVFEAKTLVLDFAKVLKIDPELFEDAKGEAESLAGLILELEGKIPEKGDVIQFDKFEFMVEAVDRRRIKRIRVKIK